MTTTTVERTVNVEFLYLDLDRCQRCGGTDENLANAISAVRPALSGAGLDLVVTRTLVENAQHVAELGFVSSPTIRVDGIDAAGELRESI
jgi:hypothetical protein